MSNSRGIRHPRELDFWGVKFTGKNSPWISPLPSNGLVIILLFRACLSRRKSHSNFVRPFDTSLFRCSRKGGRTRKSPQPSTIRSRPLSYKNLRLPKHAAWKDKLDSDVQEILKLEYCKGRAGTNICAKAKDVKRTHSSVESGEPKKKTKRATFEGRADQLFERVKTRVKLFLKLNIY